MGVVIETIGVDRLAEYAGVPMVCDVRSMFAIDEIDDGTGGFSLREEPVRIPFSKDYDAYADGGPLDWPARFDVSKWGLWIGHDAEDVAGAAAVAWDTPALQMLEGRSDWAVLWDIRVRASSRRQGIGTALFQEAARWAKSKGCSLLKVETQNVNVGACRFYARMGCSLGGIDRQAYRQCPDIADEVMLIWHLDLSS